MRAECVMNTVQSACLLLHTPLQNSNLIYSLCCFFQFNLGRAPETETLGLDKLGVRLNKETGKIVVGIDESTSVPNIYAFGDIGEVSIVNRCHSDSRCNRDNRWKALYIFISLILNCIHKH